MRGLDGRRPNVLFVTLDQFRADALSCAGHPLVRTPCLDEIAAQGTRFARHYAQAAPCAPGRAALYTGTYQMTNRVVANGTPLDARFDNVALAACRAGYVPRLFGYTDAGVDPRTVTDPHDLRLSAWEGVLPGFDEGLHLDGAHVAWLAELARLGYDAGTADEMLETEDRRPAGHSVTTFLTDVFVDRLRTGALAPRGEPWFAHLSYLRPHPPYVAAGEFASLYEPTDCPPALPIPDRPHRLHTQLLASPLVAAPRDAEAIARLRAQYYGNVSHVDAQLGRVFGALRTAGEWDDTVVVITADHGEQLGDQGLVEKCGFYEASYHVIGMVRWPGAPGGIVVDEFTENVDVFPTLCDAMGIDVPAQCDGLPLTPFVFGERPPHWRTAAHYQWDWRYVFIGRDEPAWPWDRRLDDKQLTVRRSRDRAYLHLGDGSWRCFDLTADPTWQTEVTDAAIVLAEAHAMLDWRSRHTDRTLTGMLLVDGGIGRRPPGSPPTAATPAR